MQSYELLREVFKAKPPKQVSEDIGLSVSVLYKWAEPPDPDAIAALARRIEGPLNVMMRPGLLPLAEMARLGVRRVSLGGGLTGAVYGFAARTLAQLWADGDFTAAASGMTHMEMMALVAGFGG